MVSTDDAEIAEIAKKAGAKVPFMRSDAASGDYASTDDVIREVLDAYAAQGKKFDAFCCIYPTAPFVTAEKLKTAMQMLKTADSVMPVVPFSFPVQRGLLWTAKAISVINGRNMQQPAARIWKKSTTTAVSSTPAAPKHF